ncbi:hypothetical protein JKF63_03591 [Porcisia hertigi]|uniref:Zinc finger protein kinase-like n=1 Tax=Porcisia hertigi TaxID=2761500 RepID=A0A836L874_9TRYP|nr:hypothetical protein JKF63_03591 [Porcisia hertigi]
MSLHPFEMFFSYFRRRSHTAHSALASTASHTNGENSPDAITSAPSGVQAGNAGPTGSASGAATAAIALPHSNDSTPSLVAQSGDRRAFEGEERLFEHPHVPRQYPLDPEKDAEVLVLLAQQYSITSVVITHYRVKENYVEYVIECVRGHDAWRVYRRYQQFKALDHDLKQVCSSRHGSNHGAYGVVPVLPGSHWMDVTNQSPELVEQRRRYLEIYLQQLLVPNNLFYVARTQLYDFLHEGEVPTHVKHTGIQPLLGLISTRTDFVADEDGDDEGIRREQERLQSRQRQQPLTAMEEPTVAVAGTETALTLSSSSSNDTCPSVPVHRANSAATSMGAAFPGVSGDGKAEVRVPEATATTATKTSSMPGGAATDTPNGLASYSRTAHAEPGDEVNKDGEASQGRGPSSYATDTDRAKLTKKDAHRIGSRAAHTAVESMQTSFSDERLPPASANCAQCNAEFSSFLYPHRCFFCRVQFCSACLQHLSMLGSAAAAGSSIASLRSPSIVKAASSANEKAGGRTVPACRQCAENYSRRLDRCGTAPGSGTYRGMQSTLSTPTPPGQPVPGESPLQPSSHVAALPSAMSLRSCVGEEGGSVMLQRGVTNSAVSVSHPPYRLPRGALSSVDFDDFQLLTVIGRGTFGMVLKVKMRTTQTVYAMKIMNKATVYRRCMTSYMKEEKTILTSIRPHPYIVRCHYAFQTEYYLVLVIDYLPGGELYDYIYPKLRLSPEAACIYAAELVLALECLHSQDVVHRDLKPENVVLTVDGHICLTDFGLARRSFSRSRRRSFVGSPEYVAPEIIQGQVQTAAVDWWSFGVMLYEMLSGRTPFYARNNNTVYDNVLHKELELPVLAADDGTGAVNGVSTFRGFSLEAASLLTGLLTRDPSKRLQDANAIKRHPFFCGVDWEDLRHRRVPAPCIPGDMRDNDVRHFKRDFVSEWASVPPLTNMTRASIEALVKCFDNFPVTRSAAYSGLALHDSACTVSARPASHSPSLPPHSPGSRLEDTRASSTSLMLPPSVFNFATQTPREPVRFFHSMDTAQRFFHGTWRVVSIEAQALDDGRVIFPWGGDVLGLLMYSTDGRFSLQLTSSTRRPMGPVQRVTQLSKEDLCDTYCSYVASFGRFQLFPSSMDDGCGVVRHFAEGNLCPNLALTNTVFQYRMHAEPLCPSAAKEGPGGEGNTKLTGAAKPATRILNTEHAQDTSAIASHGRIRKSGSSGGAEDGRCAEESNSDKSVGFGDAIQQPEKDAASATSAALERRIMLHLSTRPQRALEQDFLAFTSLVFEKVV